MAPVRNTRVIFNKVPDSYPVLGETLLVDRSQAIDLDNVSLAGGKVLGKTLSISIDPFLRGRMRDDTGIEGYAFELGKPIFTYAIVKVIRSENPKVKPGDHLYNPFADKFDVAEYQILDDVDNLQVLDKYNVGIPWSAFLGPAGMTGQTAYYGWKELAPKKGETIYISTAAGAVGSIVVQLAKAVGLKVIGSAGQDHKLDFLRELGADVVFNYKTTSVDDVLREHGPVDIYWDHVGGKTLTTTLNHMNVHGRVLIIGLISGYNSASLEQAEPITNIHQALFKRLTIRGLLVSDYHDKYLQEFYSTFPARIKSGEIKYNESVARSVDDAPQLIIDVQKGDNKGKAVIVLSQA
ncbi:alcohol dehydrogenase [Auricularia subglabra TFB-10046 SS5]|nr:alcohol dehydrogenase [Auricularia subglabra TFB-10046 SS5]